MKWRGNYSLCLHFSISTGHAPFHELLGWICYLDVKGNRVGLFAFEIVVICRELCHLQNLDLEACDVCGHTHLGSSETSRCKIYIEQTRGILREFRVSVDVLSFILFSCLAIISTFQLLNVSPPHSNTHERYTNESM